MAESQIEAEHANDSSLLIDQIEAILNSPVEFTSNTLESRLIPLLEQIRDVDDTRITRLEKWCDELDDASRAAYVRETILKLLSEVEEWDNWKWNLEIQHVEEKKGRVEEIREILTELPIEWLKSRVTGTFLLPLFPSPHTQQKQHKIKPDFWHRTTQKWEGIAPSSLPHNSHHLLPLTSTVKVDLSIANPQSSFPSMGPISNIPFPPRPT